MKNYKLQQQAINKHYNTQIKKLKKAESFFNEKGLRIENPTEKQRANAINLLKEKLTKALKYLDAVAEAEPLEFIKIKVEWKKSRVWGHNPHAEAWTSGGYYNTGKASGCGYCKESAAIGEALADSLSLQRFIIENLSKFRGEYGIETGLGVARLSISGKGVSTLLNIFRKVKGWTVHEMHGKSFDGYIIEKSK